MFQGINVWVLLLVLNNACQVCAFNQIKGYSHDCVLRYMSRRSVRDSWLSRRRSLTTLVFASYWFRW
jgi:hypothetical protein